MLLDTCTLLWWLTREEALPPRVREHLGDAAQPAFVSVVTLWEILLKHSLGKIGIDSGAQTAFDFLVETIAAAGFELIDLRPGDIRHISVLPPIHRDPFDRVLFCQAIERGLALVTPDVAIRRYPIRTLWG
jgi:PIN domain nuclease of toxin-antitoxin system